MRRPVNSTDRSKQTLVRGPTSRHPIAPVVIKVPYPSYGTSSSIEPQFMEFIST